MPTEFDDSKMKTMFTAYPDVVGIPELMRMLGVGRNTALSLVRSSKIKGQIIGNRYRIPKINVVAFLTGAN